MRITLLLAAAAIFGAVHDMSDRGTLPHSASLPSRSGAPLQPLSVDTPATEVCVGDVAPDFSYQGVDARWRRMRDLVATAPILLVFGANDATLRGIESEREALMDLGIIPVAVVRSRLGVSRAIANRLDLRYTVLADPQGAIATQFNAIEPANGRQLPCWFVVDAQRRVRGLGRNGLPLRGYPELAAVAMGLPPRAATIPASR